jgi:NADH-quinone oxidoreductase subunit C
MSAEDVNALQGEFGAAVLKTVEFRGEHTVVVALGSLRSILAHAHKSLGFNLLLDVSSLDHMGEDPRFEIVYELATVDDSKHLRVRAAVAEEEEVPTVSDLWATANWHEREVFDMMGIRFTDHPDLKRILMWEGYPYHPLRKDFPLTGHVEVRYSEDEKRVVYEPVTLTQEFRSFDFTSPWEGAKYILPGDEKAEEQA